MADEEADFIEDQRMPLLSQTIYTDDQSKYTTGKEWMPQGNALLALSTSINENLRQTTKRSTEGLLGLTLSRLSPDET